VILALDMADGKEKWRSEAGTAYASPVPIKLGGVDAVLAETNDSIVALRAEDGKELWQTAYVVEGRGYNAATPIVDGQTVIYSGSNRGAKAAQLEEDGDQFKSKDLWSNNDNSVIYNSPILKDGYIYGLSALDVLFCINATTGETAWSAPLGIQPKVEEAPPAQDQQGERPGGRRRGGRGCGRAGYGSIVDAGPVLFALTPLGQLVVLEPSSEEFKQLAVYKVSENQTYAYPVISGRRIFIKDDDSLTLWKLE
jgi:hypothetical protein